MGNTWKISMLQGPDRVRRRPMVIFGSTDAAGVVNAIQEILEVFVTEAVLGYSKRLSVIVHPNDSLTICSYDRGIFLDDSIEDGVPAWQKYFCDFHAGSRSPDDKYFIELGTKHHSLYGEPNAPQNKYRNSLDLSFCFYCVHCVSDYMHIESVRDGNRKTLSFSKGVVTQGLKTEACLEPSHSQIRLMLDKEIFDCIDAPADAIKTILQDVAITVPGLLCEFSDERTGEREYYQYENGIYSLAEQLCAFAPSVMEKEVCGKDRYNWQEYDAQIKIVCGFAPGNGTIKCWHDFRGLKYGGLHLDNAKKQILYALKTMFDESKLDEIENFDQISSHIVLFIDTKCSGNSTKWVNGTRTAIMNQIIVDVTHDLIDDDFRYYLRKHHDEVLEILKGIAVKTCDKGVVEL